MKTIEPNLY